MADGLGVKVMVAIPGRPAPSNAPDPNFNVEHFTYNRQNNTYTCPQGKILKTNGTWHKAKSGSQFQQFRTPDCKNREILRKCTKSEKNGKMVQRRKNAQNIEDNRIRIENNKETYKRRQAMVGHPYGTIKRQWDFSYIMTKKYIHRANADVGLMFTAYNLRRIINILGTNMIKAYLQGLVIRFFNIFGCLQLKKAVFKSLKYLTEKMDVEIKGVYKGLYLIQNFVLF